MQNNLHFHCVYSIKRQIQIKEIQFWVILTRQQKKMRFALSSVILLTAFCLSTGARNHARVFTVVPAQPVNNKPIVITIPQSHHQPHPQPYSHYPQQYYSPPPPPHYGISPIPQHYAAPPVYPSIPYPYPYYYPQQQQQHQQQQQAADGGGDAPYIIIVNPTNRNDHDIIDTNANNNNPTTNNDNNNNMSDNNNNDQSNNNNNPIQNDNNNIVVVDDDDNIPGTFIRNTNRHRNIVSNGPNGSYVRITHLSDSQTDDGIVKTNLKTVYHGRDLEAKKNEEKSVKKN